ncbi:MULTISPECIES: hypothetical protein [Sinorhizobium]|uniref:hypothetical protein n=1 Tax=Sinorhizobium TaxID=28105 RepID=UPI000BE965F7|nr:MULTISPECIES: hypothetical protein [Sinorhizobium]PDT55021.1 hypothetical protein CO664_08085 [Sinorhizobium sp. NG07B]POH32063.1 hypothetical protein ATY30_11725 [Sinorhizobium americanum]
MLAFLLKWAASGPLDRILTSLDKSIDNETERQKIAGEVVAKYISTEAETRAAAMQSRVFWYVWALFAAPVGFWLGAICFDSVFLFSGQIADLPPSVKPYATQIIAAVFGSGASVAGLQAIALAIRGRR